MTAIAPDDEMPDQIRRIMRWAVVAIVVASLGVVLGGVSLWAWAAEVADESARTKWDQQTAEHDECVVRAQTRAGTIETGHAQFAREAAAIERDYSTIELIGGIISLGDPDSTFVQDALAQVLVKKSDLDNDRAQLDVDLAEFDAARPPLDVADCAPAPAGPRP